MIKDFRGEFEKAISKYDTTHTNITKEKNTFCGSYHSQNNSYPMAESFPGDLMQINDIKKYTKLLGSAIN